MTVLGVIGAIVLVQVTLLTGVYIFSIGYNAGYEDRKVEWLWMNTKSIDSYKKS